MQASWCVSRPVALSLTFGAWSRHLWASGKGDFWPTDYTGTNSGELVLEAVWQWQGARWGWWSREREGQRQNNKIVSHYQVTWTEHEKCRIGGAGQHTKAGLCLMFWLIKNMQGKVIIIIKMYCKEWLARHASPQCALNNWSYNCSLLSNGKLCLCY